MERRPKAERLAAERIGLVAGSGRFPVLFAETARRRGVEVVAVAHLGETDPALERVVSAITWIHPGELDAMIHALQERGSDVPVVDIMTRDIPLVHPRQSLDEAMRLLQDYDVPAVGEIPAHTHAVMASEEDED